MQKAQAKKFYNSLSEEEKELIAEGIAEDIYFIDDKVCEKVLCVLHSMDRDLAERIIKINGFTMR